MLELKAVTNKKLNKKSGLTAGDKILKFNGFPAEDILDYLYYDEEPHFTLTIDRNGRVFDVNVKKGYESAGFVFKSDNMEIKTCRNKCVFCFVDQMPKNMRPSLYVKDDDYRQSFLFNNYVTLTNVTESDLDRIIRLKLTPLYVSVQAMRGETRQKLLNNRFAGNIGHQLKKLTDGGIKIDTQIVVVPGLNDGEELNYSVRELFKMYPNVTGVSVVPCGITKYREGLYPVKDISEGYAKCMVEWAHMMNAEFKVNFVCLADEYYFKAKLPVEDGEFYGDYSMVGNGVGTTAKFLEELDYCLAPREHKGKYLIACGTSAADFIDKQALRVKKFVTGLEYKAVAVKNEFFGETVNCTGLLTGRDIVNALKAESRNYDAVVIPNVCLKRDEDLFLDDMTLADFKNELKTAVIITDGSGESFFDALSGGENVRKIL